MPQLPLAPRPDTQAALNANVYCAARSGVVPSDHTESMKVHVKNTFIDGSPVSQEESPVMLSRKSSRSKTMPVQHKPYSDLSEDADDPRQDLPVQIDDDDEEDDVHGELMEETPYTRRHVDESSSRGLETFGLPSTNAQSEDVQMGSAVPSQTPAMRQIVLQIPIEVPAGIMTEDFAAQVIKTSTAIRQNSVVVDLQVSLQSQGVSVSTATPISLSATPVASASSAVSSLLSSAGASPSAPAWPTVAASPSSTPKPDKQARANEASQGSRSAASSSKQQAHTKARPQVKDGEDDARSAMVCCHWKNKGFCKLGTNCKFMHPESKQGIGPTRRKGTNDSQDMFTASWPMPAGIPSSLSYGKNHKNAQVNPMMPMMPGAFPMMMPPPFGMPGMAQHLHLASALSAPPPPG